DQVFREVRGDLRLAPRWQVEPEAVLVGAEDDVREDLALARGAESVAAGARREPLDLAADEAVQKPQAIRPDQLEAPAEGEIDQPHLVSDRGELGRRIAVVEGNLDPLGKGSHLSAQAAMMAGEREALRRGDRSRGHGGSLLRATGSPLSGFPKDDQ